MTSNENAILNLDNLPVTSSGSDEQFAALAQSSGFIGRLQLYTKGTAVNKRLIGPGEFGIPGSGESIEVLGDSVDLMVLARRAKAVDLNDTDAIVTSYDPSEDAFKDIAARSALQNSRCMYGPSFLVYERTTGRFLEFFCGTKSSRSEAGKIYPFLPLTAADIEARKAAGNDVSSLEPHGPRAMTLKSRLVEKNDWSWHVPVVIPCSTPFSNLPKVETIIEEIRKFVTAVGEQPEKVEAAEVKGRRAR
jgi:hypothetical protein